MDVREDGERAAGMAEGAMGVSKSRLEADPGVWLPDLTAEIVVICAVGGRSLQCARLLQSRGYTRVFSVSGGTTRWKAASLPMTEPLILGIGESLSGFLLQFDALGMRFNRLRLLRDPACPRCGERVTADDHVDLPAACRVG